MLVLHLATPDCWIDFFFIFSAFPARIWCWPATTTRFFGVHQINFFQLLLFFFVILTKYDWAKGVSSYSESSWSRFPGFSCIHQSFRNSWLLQESSLRRSQQSYVDSVLNDMCGARAQHAHQGRCAWSSVSTHSRCSPHHFSRPVD